MIVAEAQRRRQVVLAQVARDLGRHVGGGRDFGDRRLDALGLGLEGREPFGRLALAAARNDPDRRLREARGDGVATRRVDRRRR